MRNLGGKLLAVLDVSKMSIDRRLEKLMAVVVRSSDLPVVEGRVPAMHGSIMNVR